MMQNTIRLDFSQTEFENLIREHAARSGLPKTVQEKFIERTSQLGSIFIRIFPPYFESKDNSRFDAITQNMSELLRRLKISVKRNRNPEAGELTRKFWKKIKKEVLKDSKEIGNSYLTNCCNYFAHEIDLLFP